MMTREQKLALLRELRDAAANLVSLIRESEVAEATLATYDRMRNIADMLATSTACEALDAAA